MQKLQTQYDRSIPFNETLGLEKEQKDLFVITGEPTEDPHSNRTYLPDTLESTGDNGKTPNKVVSLRSPSLSLQHKFKVLQKWEGTIIEILNEECRAYIREFGSQNSIEEVTFSIEEIPEADRYLVVPGAIFYWSIGYDDHIDGQRNRISSIRLRRLPVWTEKELKKAEEEAKTLFKLFNSE
jgi:hypothetical protein